jgi:heme-degrading monooxygenase HmoA
MIARIWHGMTTETKSDAFVEQLIRTGVKECHATLGNRGVQVLRRNQNGAAEFFFVSFWDSWESIRAFAGPDTDKAVYYPEDKDFLTEFEPTVAHFELFDFPQPAAQGPRAA